MAGGDEGVVGETSVAAEDGAEHLAHAVLDEAGAAVSLVDDGFLVAALHELVDLAGHRILDDGQQGGGVDFDIAVLGTADVERAEAALALGGDGYRAEDAFDLTVAEAVGTQAFADELLGAGPGGHALGGDACH